MVHENFELVVGFCGNALEVNILFVKGREMSAKLKVELALADKCTYLVQARGVVRVAVNLRNECRH